MSIHTNCFAVGKMFNIRLSNSNNRIFPHIRGKVFVRGGVDPKPDANQIADRFRFKLTNRMWKILAIWPPSTVGRP